MTETKTKRGCLHLCGNYSFSNRRTCAYISIGTIYSFHNRRQIKILACCTTLTVFSAHKTFFSINVRACTISAELTTHTYTFTQPRKGIK